MGRRRIVVTDIDGTLIGDDDALARFAAWRASVGLEDVLVYATGRTLESVGRLVADTAAPKPDVVISLVGTEIHDHAGRPWPGWLERFEGWDAARVRQILAEDERLHPQPQDVQSRLKASYFAPGLTAPDLASLSEGLQRVGLDAVVVYSGDLFVDVLPAGAGKGAAARVVAADLGVELGDVLAFGDSGNDVGLFGEGFRGTIVGNASRELRHAVDGSVYRSSQPFADGILDGIRYWSGVGVADRRAV